MDTVKQSREQRALEKFFLKGKASDAEQAQTLALFTLDEVRAFNLAVMAEIYNRSQNRYICNPHQPADFVTLLEPVEQLCAKREEIAKMLWVAPFVAAGLDLTVHRYYGGGFGFSFDCDGTQEISSGVEMPFSRLSMNFFDDKAKKARAAERTISFPVTLEQAEFLLHSKRRIRFPAEAVERQRKEMKRPTLFTLIETGYQPAPASMPREQQGTPHAPKTKARQALLPLGFRGNDPHFVAK